MRTIKLLIAVMLMSGASVWAADYLMEGVDPARTGWMKDEKVFTTANVKDMKLLWKVTLDSKPREMHNLFSPLIAERVTTPEGPREMAMVAGVSDDLFGIDVATGKLVWTRQFDSTYTAAPGGRGGGTLCPGGQTAVPVMAQTGTPAATPIYAVSWDGRLRQVNVADGREIVPAEKFIPPNGKPYALTLVNGVDLHGQRAGLRRRAQRVLLLRPGHPPHQHLPAGRRRVVGSPRCRGRARGHGLPRHRRRGLQSCDPEPRQRHRRREDRRQQAAAAGRLLRAPRTPTGCSGAISTST